MPATDLFKFVEFPSQRRKKYQKAMLSKLLSIADEDPSTLVGMISSLSSSPVSACQNMVHVDARPLQIVTAKLIYIKHGTITYTTND